MGQDDDPKPVKQVRATHYGNSVIESLVSGAISSTITTVGYQPLELLKTRIQLRDEIFRTEGDKQSYFGRATKSALYLVRTEGPLSLWRGTGASLLRSGPGVGLYYALLNILQTNFSSQNHRPDSSSQAFYFGITARSLVSLVLLPITVVKVRYESGRFTYPSLLGAVKSAYSSQNGWAGLAPTVLRDSLFSGTYYMCYTKLKEQHDGDISDQRTHHLRTFSYGVISGLAASIITNPIDVLKTNIQVASSDRQPLTGKRSNAFHVIGKLLNERGGFLRFFDGLVPRSVRRTLVAASTWTFYELMMDLANTWQ